MTQSAQNLIDHLKLGSKLMLENSTFSDKWNNFYEMRYGKLASSWPHKTFSVDECNYDFFQRSLSYILGEKDMPKREVNNTYARHYIDWLIEWKKQV